jgi:hypothetical protein
MCSCPKQTVLDIFPDFDFSKIVFHAGIVNRRFIDSRTNSSTFKVRQYRGVGCDEPTTSPRRRNATGILGIWPCHPPWLDPGTWMALLQFADRAFLRCVQPGALLFSKADSVF